MVSVKWDKLTLKIKTFEDCPGYVNSSEQYRWGFDAGYRDALIYDFIKPRFSMRGSDFSRGYIAGLEFYQQGEIEAAERWKRINRNNWKKT